MSRRWTTLAFLLALGAAPRPASAQLDYDPGNEGWNGLSQLVEEAHILGVQLRVASELDFSTLDADTSLLIVYPTVDLERAALIAHLRRGGRMLIADDFGTSAELLAPLGVRRDESPVIGGIHFRDSPDLPVGAPVDEDHVLTVNVRRLLTNHPSTLVTELPPVFVTGSPPRTLVAVGAIGEGRLVILGDPSALINNMLEVRSNQQFARNLLTYLAGESQQRRLVLLTGRFGQRNGGGDIAGSAGEARRHFNVQMARLSDWVGSFRHREHPPRWLSVLAAVSAASLLLVVVIQLQPRPRYYSGRWLRPLAQQHSAGFVGTGRPSPSSRRSSSTRLRIIRG